MNPLELVAKTLYSFQEKELTFQLLDAFGKRAQVFQQYDEIAKCFFELKNFSKAIEYGEEAFKKSETQDQQYIIAKNLINAYNQSNLPNESIIKIDFCKKMVSCDPEVLLEETFAYSALNKKEKSEKLLINLLKRKDIDEEIERKARHNLSEHYFRRDDIHTGLHHFLISGEVEAYKTQKMPDYEKWDGTITLGRTIIIDNQCGAGDEVVHIRFMKHLQDLGMNPVWSSVRRDLVEFFKFNGYNAVCSLDAPEFPEDSCWVYGLSVPYYLNLTANDLGKTPYLKTIPEYDEKYKWISEEVTNKKIGLFWKSSSGYEQNLFRTTSLDDYMDILIPLNNNLFSLQMWNDNVEYGKWVEFILTFDEKDRTFVDTFSIINSMDLVVTSCSFTAHAAAALGKEVCVFVPIMEYYVWSSSTGKTHWYGDNVHIFKQKKSGSWEEPMQEFKSFITQEYERVS
jgi:tetratricopeptide (TPR) repeat protein